jgi:hypothetical protein
MFQIFTVPISVADPKLFVSHPDPAFSKFRIRIQHKEEQSEFELMLEFFENKRAADPLNMHFAFRTS